MQLYSIILPTSAMISSKKMSGFFPACFSCEKSFNLLQSSFRLSGKIVVGNPKAMLAGDWSNLLGDLSLLLLLP